MAEKDLLEKTDSQKKSIKKRLKNNSDKCLRMIQKKNKN